MVKYLEKFCFVFAFSFCGDGDLPVVFWISLINVSWPISSIERLGDPWDFVPQPPPPPLSSLSLSFVTDPIVWVVDPSSSVTRRLCLFDVVATSLLLFDFVVVVVGASEVVIEAAAIAGEEVMETSLVALGEGETDNRLLEASERGTGIPETMDWKKYMTNIINNDNLISFSYLVSVHKNKKFMNT